MELNRIKTVFINIFHLMSGKFLSLVLGFLFNIYIAKTLGASQYGIFSSVEAYTAMFGFFIFEGYQKVAIRACCGETEKIESVIENVLGIRTLLSALAVVITISCAFLFPYPEKTLSYIALFSFNLLFSSISSTLYVVYHVKSKMRFIVYANLAQYLLYIIPAAICIWFDRDVKYLIFFFTLSSLCEILINLVMIKKVFSVSLSLKRCFKPFYIEKNHFKEAFVFSFLGVIGYFHQTIDITMLSWMVSAQSVGLYVAANKFVMPMHMLGRMAKVAFFPQFIETFKLKKQIPAVTLFKISGLIALGMFPLALGIFIFSEQIILLTFGREFAGSIPVLRILCWMIPFGIIGLPFITAMQANHHEKKLILPNIMRSLSNVTLNYFFIREYGYMGAVYSTIITFSWYHCFIIAYQYHVMKRAGNIV